MTRLEDNGRGQPRNSGAPRAFAVRGPGLGCPLVAVFAAVYTASLIVAWREANSPFPDDTLMRHAVAQCVVQALCTLATAAAAARLLKGKLRLLAFVVAGAMALVLLWTCAPLFAESGGQWSG